MSKLLNSLNLRFFVMLIFFGGFIITPIKSLAEYHLVIGSYRQGPGSKPHVSGITSPSLFSIPTRTLEQCEKAGKKISNEIYKPVWQFDNRWTCVYTGTR